MNEWRKWPIRTISKDNMPECLVRVSSPPEFLYYRGEWREEFFENSLAIVGSRRMSRYGREAIKMLMPEIVARKTTVISGFMYGVDSEAHRVCVEMGGRTVAVLRGGLDYLTPIENDDLYGKILDKGGTVISEYEPRFQPTLWSFPQRNRLVAALSSHGILIVEAGLKSGSLITAKMGLKQKKKIMAIPGPINSSISAGTNWLIGSGGAKMITGPADLFNDNKSCPNQQNLFKDYGGLSTLEKNIISILENEECTSDELCQRIGCNASEMAKTISMMLMRDLLVEENGKLYLS